MIKVDLSSLRETKPHEYAMRFLFGGICTVLAGLVAKRFGPAVGGLFLAFPAIFPAGASLIEDHEKKRKAEYGLDGTVRGRLAASIAKLVVRQMKELNSGKILFTASTAGEMVAPREAVYAATKAFVLSFAHSLRYELKETGITVTALQPGPTDTDFFHRAGMDDTEVGQKGKSESEPKDVAHQGIGALFAGKDHVYAASFKTKLEGALANVVPGNLKAAMHEKMAKHNSEQ
jgi:NAD(P)-dependent dehydrogenase (short-subunit alcohol dehydrogenase family)